MMLKKTMSLFDPPKFYLACKNYQQIKVFKKISFIY